MTARYRAPTPMPDGMSAEHYARLQRLTPERRALVLERASMIHEAVPGTTWARADALALEQEAAQLRIGGT